MDCVLYGILQLIICSQSERLNREPQSLSLSSSWLQATGYDVVEVNRGFLLSRTWILAENL